jgi:hypothetical protein
LTKPSKISIVALVAEGERPAVELGAAHVARAMGQAAGTPWTVDVFFASHWDELLQCAEGQIVVTSLLTELGKPGETWPKSSERMRKAYGTLSQVGVPIFICTILRHIARTKEPEADEALRLHIRRLNLLAAEISRETRAFVIDIDRVLADIGARSLQTDYRLAGQAAAEIAGHFIALTLINNAFDDVVTYELQDAAKDVLALGRPSVAALGSRKSAVILVSPLSSVGQGRQKQVVVPTISTVPRDSGTLIRQVLRGAIKPSVAYKRLIKAVRSHGVRKSAVLIAVGLKKQFKHKR